MKRRVTELKVKENIKHKPCTVLERPPHLTLGSLITCPVYSTDTREHLFLGITHAVQYLLLVILVDVRGIELAIPGLAFTCFYHWAQINHPSVPFWYTAIKTEKRCHIRICYEFMALSRSILFYPLYVYTFVFRGSRTQKSSVELLDVILLCAQPL